MDDPTYADIAVDTPAAHARAFTYAIPPHFAVQPGQLVWVPFGAQTLQGIITSLSQAQPDFATRPILQAIEPAPLLTPQQLRLGQWLSRHYRATLFSALSLMLPPGFESRVRARITPNSQPATTDADEETETDETAAALQALTAKGAMPQSEFLKLLGRPNANRRNNRRLNRLLEQGIIQRQVTIPRPGVAPKYTAYLIPAPMPADAGDTAPAPLPPRQQALLDALRQPPQHLPLTEANREFGNAAVRALWNKELAGMEWWRTSGGPPPIPSLPADAPESLTLTPEQRQALAQITAALDASRDAPMPLPARSFLLHGVTGSGKTEVYLRAIHHALRQGRRALFLVPEIALTPQTLRRVDAWFAGRVALLHSNQTPRQKFDQWWDIRGGAFDVVVGPRSALFAPIDNPGIIIIDEEHEATYKQEEHPPLYHARAAALELARAANAIVVLGSATPSVETYYYANRGRLQLLSLPRRVTRPAQPAAEDAAAIHPPTDDADILPLPTNDADTPAGLPQVQICDMRLELRQGNRHIFSRPLTQALQECLASGRQAILFLNRRGLASIIQCRDCGFVAQCRHCDTPLAYHTGPPRLLCHQCNRSRRPFPACPQCRSHHIRQMALGTERVAAEAAALFPNARIDRLDSDAARSPGAVESAIARLASGETQILTGTQMIAKGLDIPNVTLTAAVLADIGLHIPDFRSGERVFSLLCQVAGRAGRGHAPGQVFIQTYNPDHYAIRAGARQNYQEMYQPEIQSRRQLGYPPFNQLAHIVYLNPDPQTCQSQTQAIADSLKRQAAAQGRADIQISGPAPGLPPRLRGRHRWRLLIRGRNLPQFLETAQFPPNCTIDLDPIRTT